MKGPFIQQTFRAFPHVAISVVSFYVQRDWPEKKTLHGRVVPLRAIKQSSDGPVVIFMGALAKQFDLALVYVLRVVRPVTWTEPSKRFSKGQKKKKVSQDSGQLEFSTLVAGSLLLKRFLF